MKPVLIQEKKNKSDTVHIVTAQGTKKDVVTYKYLSVWFDKCLF